MRGRVGGGDGGESGPVVCQQPFFAGRGRERRLVCSSPGGGGGGDKEKGRAAGGGVGVTEGVAHRRAQRNGPPLAGTGTAARTVRGRVKPR